MKSIIKIFPLFLLAFCFKGCIEDITVDLPEYENKVAVYGVLRPDERPEIYLNLSRSYFDYTNNHDLDFITTAQVFLENVQEGTKEQLRLDSAYERSQLQFDSVLTYFYSSPNKILPGKRYRLQVLYNGKEVTGETQVPEAAEIKNIAYEASDPNSGFMSQYYILTSAIQDQPGQPNAYRMKAVYSDSFYNPQTRRYEVSEREELGQEFTSDRGEDGRELQARLEIYEYIEPGDSLVLNLVIENATQSTADYLESVQEQSYNFDNPLSEPVLLLHNVQGGLGVFGSVSATQKYRIVVK